MKAIELLETLVSKDLRSEEIARGEDLALYYMRAATKKHFAMSQMLSLMISGANTIIGKLRCKLAKVW